MSLTAICAEGLSKSWRRHGGQTTTVLHEVNITVHAGERVALLGPSGAGKSSMLHLCAGLDDTYGGHLTILGHKLRQLSSVGKAKLRRRHIGFASQQGDLVRNVSVLDNITMACWLAGFSADPQRALELMDWLDIAHLTQSAPQDLSGGEVARVALARALYHRPKLLLCDEPTHGLDSERRRKVHDLLFLAASQGTTLLVATHDETLAQAMDRRLTLLRGVLTEANRQ